MNRVAFILTVAIGGFLPLSSSAQDFSGGIDKPKEHIQADAVGYAVYNVPYDHIGDVVDLTEYGFGKSRNLKPEWDHCISCGADVLFWPDGSAYVYTKICQVDYGGYVYDWGGLDSRTRPPYPTKTYVANASYTIDGPRLTLTYREWHKKVFTAYEHGKFESDCGTIRFDEKQLNILTKGTYEMRNGGATSPSYPTIRIIHD